MFLSKASRCRAWSTLGSSSLVTRQGTALLKRSQFHVSATASALRMASGSGSGSADKDSSALSKSRAPFRMPKSSPDDSKAPANSSKQQLTWNPLGLITELVDCLENELELKAPTPVQSLVIPELLSDSKDSLAFLAATGSGKTLAYLLPLMQQLKQEEMFENYERKARRPRLLVLAPTRELALQITQVLKSMSHSCKLSSQALVGGQDKGKQRKALSSRPVDVIVATPGRLLQHWKDESVFLGSVRAIVIDEMDTMLEQGFQRELREILYPILYAGKPAKDSLTPPPLKDTAPRIILTSATMTQSIQKLLGDNPKTSKLSVGAKRLHAGASRQEEQQQSSGAYTKLHLPPMRIVTAPGLHKSVPRLEQVFVDVGNTDKISLLVDVVSSQKNDATIIFCNTAASVRAVQYALAESRIESLAYHGELNSAARADNLQMFRQPSDTPKYLVCTDLAARGLDIPEVEHVVMFDFPLNAFDYLHRSGRTARGAGRGKVSALVAKRDRVLALAIEQAVLRGDTLDGLSSRKSDYLPGARLGTQAKSIDRRGRSGPPPKQARRTSKTRRSSRK